MTKEEIAEKLGYNLKSWFDRFCFWFELSRNYFTDSTSYVYFRNIGNDKYLICMTTVGY